MKLPIRSLMFLFLMCSAGLSVYGQESKYKALYLYNFTRYIDWDKTSDEDNFVIAVLGENKEIVDELIKISQKQKVGSQKITIKKYASINEVKKCQILFVSKKETKSIETSLNKIQTGTLIVSENDNALKKGACINFFSEDKRLKFEISEKNIKSRGLNISKKLLDLGQRSN